LEVAALPLLLDVNPGFLRQAPVMSLEVLDPPLLELERDVLRPAPSVREDQRRAALLDEAREEIVHPRVRLLQCILREVPDGTHDGDVEGLPALDLDDVNLSELSLRIGPEVLADRVDPGDCRREADAGELRPDVVLEPLK